jgi:hypothetical protein
MILKYNITWYLCGCNIRSFAPTDEYKLMEMEKRVLRGMYEPKIQEVVEGLRILHNEELCNLFSSLNI